MTREEAIVYFEKVLAGAKQGLEKHPEVGKRVYGMRKELSEIALSALRPVSREQVEKAEWIWSTGDVYTCSSCGEKTHVDERMESPIYNFCPFCMAPMTDEAVQMVIDRMEGMENG